ncbi:TetR/AcrR family transcriptional regulator [Aquipseudomonas ullengensis]|uniref:TetR/AcrR family transcriptional regulator n=1 Tax=Aquipseudomonas ullengensis TaxID=2759166 RepID=A0A7W4QA41_9GAMM|nr:TetR/AcrR family transcriptional regulator [Pseudomonas ullengensis]MBB2495284.1 TetR/AcrR family transcriptional regulator [Pseudomonas ullengensis]
MANKTLSSTPPTPRVRREPKQERSQVRFEAILKVALELIAARGYEAVSMREIAREASLPIASLYLYFPTKLAIVQEVWQRYTSSVGERLQADLAQISGAPDSATAGAMIERLIDLMVDIQSSHPGFVEVWGCVVASPELRALNSADTLATTELVARAICAAQPAADPEQVRGLALLLCEAGSSVTKLALSLPEPERSRTLLQLKRTLQFVYANSLEAFARQA